jgi:hypothetical protein
MRTSVSFAGARTPNLVRQDGVWRETVAATAGDCQAPKNGRAGKSRPTAPLGQNSVRLFALICVLGGKIKKFRSCRMPACGSAFALCASAAVGGAFSQRGEDRGRGRERGRREKIQGYLQGYGGWLQGYARLYKAIQAYTRLFEIIFTSSHRTLRDRATRPLYPILSRKPEKVSLESDFIRMSLSCNILEWISLRVHGSTWAVPARPLALHRHPGHGRDTRDGKDGRGADCSVCASSYWTVHRMRAA